jgi:hypothetical protein
MDIVEKAIPENEPTPKELIWRRNCPYLYSLLYVTELNWPSLTVDWISAHQSTQFADDIDNAYNLVYGTQTDNT